MVLLGSHVVLVRVSYGSTRISYGSTTALRRASILDVLSCSQI